MVNELGNKHGYKVSVMKDGRIFESKEFHSYTAAVFFTTGDLTTLGTDGKPPMTPQGKQALLNAVKGGMGFVGVHAASDTFHTPPDPEDRSNRYVAHGEQSDPYLRMLGGEFITHGSEPRLQAANLIVNDPKFPGLEGVTSPVSFKEEWYSLKDFTPDLHVILVQDTQGMQGPSYQRPSFPATWARMYGKGRVFYTSMGHREDVWANPIFQNLLLGALSWATHQVDADLTPNLQSAAPRAMELPNPPPERPRGKAKNKGATKPV